MLSRRCAAQEAGGGQREAGWECAGHNRPRHRARRPLVSQLVGKGEVSPGAEHHRSCDSQAAVERGWRAGAARQREQCACGLRACDQRRSILRQCRHNHSRAAHRHGVSKTELHRLDIQNLGSLQGRGPFESPDNEDTLRVAAQHDGCVFATSDQKVADRRPPACHGVEDDASRQISRLAVPAADDDHASIRESRRCGAVPGGRHHGTRDLPLPNDWVKQLRDIAAADDEHPAVIQRGDRVLPTGHSQRGRGRDRLAQRVHKLDRGKADPCRRAANQEHPAVREQGRGMAGALRSGLRECEPLVRAWIKNLNRPRLRAAGDGAACDQDATISEQRRRVACARDRHRWP